MNFEQAGVSCEQAMAGIAEVARDLPGAWEDHPWGETVFKAANKKVFVFTSIYQEVFRCTFKLPHTGEAALTMFSFCSPTGYGLGKAGWVTAAFPLGETVPLPVLIEWLQESYAAVAGERSAAKARQEAEGRSSSKKKGAAKPGAKKATQVARSVDSKKNKSSTKSGRANEKSAPTKARQQRSSEQRGKQGKK